MPIEPPELHRQTLAAQGMGRVALPYRDVVPPIHVSTTYERAADGAFPGGRTYSRADNPSYDQAEALVASLEGAASALLFSSGQSAAGAVFQALAPGDGVLAPRYMYWALRKWWLEYAAPWGLAGDFYDNASVDDLAAAARCSVRWRRGSFCAGCARCTCGSERLAPTLKPLHSISAGTRSFWMSCIRD